METKYGGMGGGQNMDPLKSNQSLMGKCQIPPLSNPLMSFHKFDKLYVHNYSWSNYRYVNQRIQVAIAWY